MRWQGDVARGKRGVRRSRYAKMRPQAEYGKVEEHEPVYPRLWAETSPPPTRFIRWYTVWGGAQIWLWPPIVRLTGRVADKALGECVARPRGSYRLAASKGKDCDRQPNPYVRVRHVNWGRSIEMPRERDLDARWAGGVPVVVRGGESPLHGEGEQFKWLV